MPYKVIENDKQFRVVERRSETNEELTIRTFLEKEEARKFSRSLNFGAGFDGWTPNFFLDKVKIPRS